MKRSQPSKQESYREVESWSSLNGVIIKHFVVVRSFKCDKDDGDSKDNDVLNCHSKLFGMEVEFVCNLMC